MRISTISTLFVLAALAAPVSAQESNREDFNEFCKAIGGRWVGEVTWIVDWPGIGKKGDKVTCYAELTVVEDGHAMTGRWWGGAGSGTGLCYFDAAAKQIMWIWVNSGGAVSQGTIAKKGKSSWVESTSGCLPDGTKLTHTSTLTFSDDGNTHTYLGGGTAGDKKTDPRHDVWRRAGK
ncbi:MAG: hypothetical protein ACOX1P_24535 [Thermoguttaceae bacterium]|jgi:hypothetical protein